MERIDSVQNSRVRKWASLHQKKYRDQLGLFLVEGEHLTEEALKAGAVEEILTDTPRDFPGVPVILVTPAILHKLSANPSGTHLLAVCRQKTAAVTARERLLLLDDVQDPGNLGTLIRTAVSFGFQGILCSEGCCDLYNGKAVRSTQGALFALPVVRTDLAAAIDKLKQDGVRIYATALQQARPMQQVPACEKLALILGNEGQGMHAELLKLADERIRIEMDGFESLNVAVAGGILMYHYRRK